MYVHPATKWGYQKEKSSFKVARTLLLNVFSRIILGEAIMTDAYLIYRIPSRILGNDCPVESLVPPLPSIPRMQFLESWVFGCGAFVHIHPHKNKLNSLALQCVMPLTKGRYKRYHSTNSKYFVSMECILCPLLHGESNSLESEFECELEFLFLGPWLPKSTVFDRESNRICFFPYTW